MPEKQAKPRQKSAGSTEPQPKRETIRPENPLLLHVNHLEITATPWDFILKFGDVLEVSPEKILARETIRLAMSPQHLRAVYTLIGKQLRNYEEAYGGVHGVDIQAVAVAAETDEVE